LRRRVTDLLADSGLISDREMRHARKSELGAALRAAYRNRTDDLRITSVSRALLAGFKARASFRCHQCGVP